MVEIFYGKLALDALFTSSLFSTQNLAKSHSSGFLTITTKTTKVTSVKNVYHIQVIQNHVILIQYLVTMFNDLKCLSFGGIQP